MADLGNGLFGPKQRDVVGEFFGNVADGTKKGATSLFNIMGDTDSDGNNRLSPIGEFAMTNIESQLRRPAAMQNVYAQNMMNAFGKRYTPPPKEISPYGMMRNLQLARKRQDQDDLTHKTLTDLYKKGLPSTATLFDTVEKARIINALLTKLQLNK